MTRSTKPRLLDLYCGAGGAAVGYHRAGFDVVGVDHQPQPNYPFRFFQGDALDFPLDGFDAIHASPPCQAHTSLSIMPNARDHPNLIPETRARLQTAGVPYVIENVMGAKLWLNNPVRLCGTSFGLETPTHQLHRHRLFECNFPLLVPPCRHDDRPVLGVYGDHARDNRRAKRVGDGQFSAADGLSLARRALDIDWMGWREICQAIPPAFTEHIGLQLIEQISHPLRGDVVSATLRLLPGVTA